MLNYQYVVLKYQHVMLKHQREMLKYQHVIMKYMYQHVMLKYALFFGGLIWGRISAPYSPNWKFSNIFLISDPNFSIVFFKKNFAQLVQIFKKYWTE